MIEAPSVRACNILSYLQIKYTNGYCDSIIYDVSIASNLLQMKWNLSQLTQTSDGHSFAVISESPGVGLLASWCAVPG